MRKIDFFSWLMVLCFAVPSFAQVTWNAKEHTFKDVQYKIPVTYEFKFANISSEAVEVEFVKTSCLCLVPFWETYAIPQQGIGSVRVTFDADHTGQFNEEIKVHFKDMLYPYILHIRGNVASENIKDLLITKPAISNNSINSNNNNTPPPTQPNNNGSVTINLNPPTNSNNTPPTNPNSNNTTNNNIRVNLNPPTKPQPNIPNNNTVTTNKPKYKSQKIAPIIRGALYHNTAANSHFMSGRAKEMIQEINLLRSNPKGYIKVVESYIQFLKNEINLHPSMHSMYGNEITVAQELIRELETTPPLSILQPHAGIYKAAQVHGDDAKISGQFNHRGTDGSMPWDRILKYATDMKDGNENLVGGLKDIRRSILVLLIDDGIPNRGHRRTLLNPNWTHVACYEIGRVNDMPHCWVQNFGQSKSNIPSAYNMASNQTAADFTTGSTNYTTQPSMVINKPKRKQPKKKTTITLQPNNTPPSKPTVNNNPPIKEKPAIGKPKVSITPPGKPSNETYMATQPNNQPPSKPDRVAPNQSNLDRPPGKPNNSKITINLNKPAISKPSTTTSNTESSTYLTTKIAPKYQFSTKHNTALHVNYMTTREKLMLAEINYLRAEPREYLKVVKGYIDFMENEIAQDPAAVSFYEDDLKTAKEVTGLLERISPLPILRPHKGIYKAAKVHGDEAKNKGRLEHQGSDNSMPWDRVRKYATDMMDGNENIVGGPRDIRAAVLELLIDSDVKNRGHRKTLLNAKWQFAACYEVGTVGHVPNYWLQVFGQPLPSGSSTYQDPINNPPARRIKPPKPSNSNQDLPAIPQPPSKSNTTTVSPKKEIIPGRSTIELNSPDNEVLGFATDVPQTITTIAPTLQAHPSLLNAKTSIALTNREKQLIREINYLRSNPQTYSKIVESYIVQLENRRQAIPTEAMKLSKTIEAATDIKNKLMNMSPLSLIKPNDKLYTTAKNHGLDVKEMGNLSHVGSDGSTPWNRIAKSAKYFTDGQELLIGNVDDIRAIIINFLIDEDFPQRPNQKILLNPKWNYLGTYEAGTVGNMKDCWIITFGK